MNKKLMNIGFVVIGLMVVVALALFSYNQITSMQDKTQVAKAEQQQKVDNKDKDKAFNKAYDLFLTNASTVKNTSYNIASEFQKEWHNFIFTDDYTAMYYITEQDAFNKVRKDLNENDVFNSLDEATSRMNDYYTEMEQNVTDKTKNKFSQAGKVKSAVMEMKTLTEPSGTLTDYTNQMNSIHTNTEAALETAKSN